MIVPFHPGALEMTQWTQYGPRIDYGQDDTRDDPEAAEVSGQATEPLALGIRKSVAEQTDLGERDQRSG